MNQQAITQTMNQTSRRRSRKGGKRQVGGQGNGTERGGRGHNGTSNNHAWIPHSNHRPKPSNDDNKNLQHPVNRVAIEDVQLLETTGIGDTLAQKAITRIGRQHFLNVRMNYLEPPPCHSFTPPRECCAYRTSNAQRFEDVESLCSKALKLDLGGDDPVDMDWEPTVGRCIPPKTPQQEQQQPRQNKQPCRYGDRRRRADCWFDHPREDSANTPSKMPQQGQQQRRRNKQPCHYGDRCRRANCWFDHPRDSVAASCNELEVKKGGNRWVPPAQRQQTSSEAQRAQQVVMPKALAVLNKVSWTNLEKCLGRFMEVTKLQQDTVVRKACIELLVEKSQNEHHFGPLYAELCTRIGKHVPPFRKELLEHCQSEFQKVNVFENAALETTNAKAVSDQASVEEQEYHARSIRKAHVGHMKFLGELYIRNVMKSSHILQCLEILLNDIGNKENNLEYFAALMTIVGRKVEGDTTKRGNRNKIPPFDWSRIEALTVANNRSADRISNRIKFLLKDLLELKERDWVSRRKEEKATTLQEIHNQHSKEQNFIPNTSTTAHREKNNKAPSSSKTKHPKKFPGNISTNSAAFKPPQGIKPAPRISKPAGTLEAALEFTATEDPPPATRKVLPPNPEECSKKTKSLLKEYFVGGDIDNAVLSIDELVQTDQPGAAERGAKIVETATLLVMEMKETQVQKALSVLKRCCVVTGSAHNNKVLLGQSSVLMGLQAPLELLGDIEIDAPLAGSLLALIITNLVDWGALSLVEFPPELVTDPASDKKGGAPFAEKVLQQRETMLRRHRQSSKVVVAAPREMCA